MRPETAAELHRVTCLIAAGFQVWTKFTLKFSL